MPNVVSNLQPSLVLNPVIQTTGYYPGRDGSDGYVSDTVGQIHFLAGTYTGRGAVDLNGDPISIQSNAALYSLLGTNFGGDGRTVFAVPDLGGQLNISYGQGPGLGSYIVGDRLGQPALNLITQHLPGAFGGFGLPVDNHQPTLTIGWYINVSGNWPSSMASNMIGAVAAFAGTFEPSGTMLCDGRLLPINQYTALFSIIGTTYGGDGQTTFALPDLRGRTIIGAGLGSDGHNYVLGEVVGSETLAIGSANMPGSVGGSGQAMDNRAPGLVLNALFCANGLYQAMDSDITTIGEIIFFAGSRLPDDAVPADGGLLSITENSTAYLMVGNTFGGDGQTTFAVPNLAGRSVMGDGNGYFIGDVTGSSTMTVGHGDLPGMAINGTSGDEAINGATAHDTLNGADGNDRLNGDSGNDTLSGGGGHDTLNGDGGNDTLNASLGNDQLNGADGNDSLDGGDGNDAMNGDAGNDTMQGGNGADTFRGGAGDDLMVGATGRDRVDYSAAAGGVQIDLVIAVAQDTGGAGIDTLNGIENIQGSQHADTLLGTNGINWLSGLDGDDRLDGRGGNDTLLGGNGSDTLIGGDGNDTFNGGAGSDTADYSGAGSAVSVDLRIDGFQSTGGAGSDALHQIENLIGSIFGDVFNGNLLANALNGGDGADTIYGQGGADALHGESGNDLLNGGAGNDLLHGGTGNDVLGGGIGADTFRIDTVPSATDLDVIVDFTSGQDTIELSIAALPALAIFGPGALEPGELNFGTARSVLPAYLIYESSTGILYYDADAEGGNDPVAIAMLGANTALAAADIVLI